MRVPFIKMHGLGNDFVVLDAREQSLPPVSGALVTGLADRETGIGFDQLILLEPTDEADFRVRFWNADGEEVGACGNGSRAVALYHGQPAEVLTDGGVLQLTPLDGGAEVDMGVPRFDWEAIPLAYGMDTLHMPVAWDELEGPSAVNVGNPHVIFFVEDCDAVELDLLGPQIERDALFPERVNVNVASVEDERQIHLRVWERGAGLTLACGTGACATAVAAIRRGLCEREVAVHLPGGPLEIIWKADETVLMRGPAQESFRGTFDWGDYS